jgi:putative transcriptional regulator
MASELAPGFLVASPSLLDPNFKRAVVLLIDHRSEGSLGFVVNRPARISFKGVVEDLGMVDPVRSPPEVPVLVGGPVAPHTGWIVFDPTTSPLPVDGAIDVTEHLRVSASREMLRLLAKLASARRHQLVLGYSGWGAGQLDQEIKQGAWIPVDLSENVVFDTPYDQRWNSALATLGINPMLLVGTGATDA